MRLAVLVFALLLSFPAALAQADRPLLLVHGFLTKSFGVDMCWDAANQTKLGSWRYLQSNLVADGLYSDGGVISGTPESCPALGAAPPVYRFTYYHECYERGNAIEVYTQRLAKAIEFAKTCSNASSVDLVAHSMGGVVARNYLEEHGNSSVRKVVYIATPHEGIGLFPLALAMPACALWSPLCPDEVKSLMSSSALMKKLNSEAIPSVQAFTIKGQKDYFIPASGPDAVPAQMSFSVPCEHDMLFRPNHCPKGYAAILTSLRT